MSCPDKTHREMEKLCKRLAHCQERRGYWQGEMEKRERCTGFWWRARDRRAEWSLKHAGVVRSLAALGEKALKDNRK